MPQIPEYLSRWYKAMADPKFKEILDREKQLRGWVDPKKALTEYLLKEYEQR